MSSMTIDEFMNRIAGIESPGATDPWTVQNDRTQAHGKWQIMPDNWAPWAREAGLPGNAPRSAENQTRVARHKMQQYHNDYGSWEAAAIAWFAGPDRARRYNAGDMSVLNFSDGNMTVGEYVDRISQGGGGGQPDFSASGAVGADSMLGDNQLEPPRNEQVRGLWTHMLQSVSNQVRSGSRDGAETGRESELFDEGPPPEDENLLQPPGGGPAPAFNDAALGEIEPGKNRVPGGLQANAARGAAAARQMLGFEGEIGGLGERGHKSDHPHGNAIDVMTYEDIALGQRHAEFFHQNREALGVTYIIFNGKIASPRDNWQWRTYKHPGGRTDPTAMHADHVHISFRGGQQATGGQLSTPAAQASPSPRSTRSSRLPAPRTLTGPQ